MVHKRIPIENALPHFDDVKVVISQSHSIPEQTAIARLVGLTVTILPNDILNCIKFTSTVIGINNNLLSPQNLLLPSVHQVILVDSIFLPLIIARLLLELVCLARRAAWEYRAGIEVIISVRFLLVGSCELVGSLVANDHIGTVLLLL